MIRFCAQSLPFFCQGVQAVSTGEGGLLVVASTSGLSVYDVRGEEPRLLAQHNEAGSRGVQVRTCRKDGMELCIIAVTLDSGMFYLQPGIYLQLTGWVCNKCLPFSL